MPVSVEPATGAGDEPSVRAAANPACCVFFAHRVTQAPGRLARGFGEGNIRVLW
jgi:hypothetical protein